MRTSKIDTAWLHARTDYDVFARGDGELVRIRPATGTMTRTVLPPLDSTGPVWFVVRHGVALVHPLDFVSDYRIPDDKPARVAKSIRNGGMLLPGPRSGLVWAEQVVDGEDAGKPTFRLLRLDGSPTGVSVTVPAELGRPQVASDGTGGLLISGRGGAYLSHGHGLHRVTHGSVVATGPKTMVLVECDTHGRCRPVVADRVTGDRRSPPQLPGWLANGSAFGVTSPDGQTLAVASGVGDSPIITIIDLATGHTRTVSVRVHIGVPSRSSAQMAWSPDSKWLFVAAYDGSLKVVNTDTGRVRDLGAAGSDVEQVAVRKAPAQRHKSLAPASKEHADGS